MSNLLNSFIETAKRSDGENIQVIRGSLEEIPPVLEKERARMEVSFGDDDLVDASDSMEKFGEEESFVMNEEKSHEDGEESILCFEVPEVEIPYYFNSFDEMGLVVAGNVFLSEGLKSINLSYFGKLLDNIVFNDFTKVKFGKFEFLIKNNSDRMIYIFEFLTKARDSLVKNNEYSCDLVKEIFVNDTRAYTLVLTPKELLDIQRSYPSYKITYKDAENITDLKLIIKI